nr:immunoglobulin heavy chain junction region [Macaca mulatta]MOW24652.1 immunoglobulin heavy chain junction region [Macaca mulatta]MOW25073.1 immunoglobulin heavy chain junction region [Macaca mulatta]MOW25632.1 immunoglobulin heavy chain junction region [Macaca mulatta]MOW26254.1 immunoglobulin heavy chain junction region [Macaca mulatta]
CARDGGRSVYGTNRFDVW